MRKNHERIQLDYCFIVTDGLGILAVDTLGYQIPLRKSRIIPRQEQMIYEMMEDEAPADYSFIPSTKKEHHILSPEPHLMLGLTRKERKLKQLLFMALDHIYTSKIQPKSVIGIQNGRHKNTQKSGQNHLMKCGINYMKK